MNNNTSNPIICGMKYPFMFHEFIDNNGVRIELICNPSNLIPLDIEQVDKIYKALKHFKSFTREKQKQIIIDCQEVMIEQLNEVINHSESQCEKVKKKDNKYIYLMQNNRNKYIKIGISSNPKNREGTLQSEEPEIILIFKKKVSYALKTERQLHSKYNKKRLRGEWFALTNKDIEDIKNTLNNMI